MANEEFLAKLQRNAARYQEIKHLADRVKSLGSGYANAKYKVRLDDETRALSDDDLIVLCDDGNACFGGAIYSRFEDSVTVNVYTD